jgi:hypothetical protein
MSRMDDFGVCDIYNYVSKIFCLYLLKCLSFHDGLKSKLNKLPQKFYFEIQNSAEATENLHSDYATFH